MSKSQKLLPFVEMAEVHGGVTMQFKTMATTPGKAFYNKQLSDQFDLYNQLLIYQSGSSSQTTDIS